ncbi:hypothetical protein ACXIUH_08770 [Vibrio parahaemolyticus]
MKVGIESIDGITTVGELIAALSKFDQSLPIECEFEKKVSVSLMADYETRQPEYVEISGEY